MRYRDNGRHVVNAEGDDEPELRLGWRERLAYWLHRSRGTIGFVLALIGGFAVAALLGGCEAGGTAALGGSALFTWKPG